MQYGDIVTRAFSIVWRRRYLWLLALLGGADAGGSSYGGNFSGNSFGTSSGNNGTPSIGAGGTPDTAALTQFFQRLGDLLQANLGQILIALAVLGLVWFL